MPLLVSKTIRSDHVVEWHWSRDNEHGTTRETSIDAGGYPTLSELLSDVKTRFPTEEILGVGADEPEAEGLTW